MKNKMNLINESYVSDILRRLDDINTKQHVDISGKEQPALSKEGMLFLKTIPLLWDRITDDNITIYMDSDLVQRIPNKLYSEDDGNDVKVYRHNLSATIDNYEKDKDEEERYSSLNSSIRDVYSKLDIMYRNAKRTGDRELADELEEKKNICAAIKNDTGRVSTSGLLHKLRNEAVGNYDLSTVEKILSLLDGGGAWKGNSRGYEFLKNWLSKEDYDFLEECISKFREPYEEYMSKLSLFNRGKLEDEPKFSGGPTSHDYGIDSRDDIFTQHDYSNPERIVYPTKKEYLMQILPNDPDMIELMNRDSIFFDSVILEKMHGYNSDATLKGKAMSEVNDAILKEYHKYLKHELVTNLSDEQIKSRLKDMINILRKYKTGRYGDASKNAKNSSVLMLLNHLYRKSRNIVSKQRGSLLNNLDDYIFDYSNAFNIVILCDKNFKIKYVLSYFVPSETTFMLFKSNNAGILYGWGEGDNVSSVLNKLKMNSGNVSTIPDKYANNGFNEYKSYTEYSIRSIKRDESITTAIVIGSDKKCVNTEDKLIGGRSSITKMYGKMSNKVKNMYGIGHDEDENRLFIKKYGDNKYFDPSLIEKSLTKEGIVYNRNGDTIYIDVNGLDSQAFTDKLVEILGGDFDIDPQKMMDGLNDIEDASETYKAFVSPSMVDRSKFESIYKKELEYIGLDESCYKDNRPDIDDATIKKVYLKDGRTFIGEGSFIGKVYIPFKKIEIGGNVYGPEVGTDSLENYGIGLSELTIVDTGVMDSLSFDYEFFYNLITSGKYDGYEEFSTKFTTLCDDNTIHPCGMSINEMNKKLSKPISKGGVKGNKMLQLQYKEMIAQARRLIIERMSTDKENPLYTISSGSKKIVDSAVIKLNRYITPRCKYIKFSLSEEETSGTLRQHFYTGSAIRASRTGMWSDNKMRRLASIEDETKQIREFKEKYVRPVSDEMKRTLSSDSITVSNKELAEVVVGENKMKKCLNTLASGEYAIELNLPRTFTGYDFFNNDGKTEAKIESSFDMLITDVTTDIMSSKDYTNEDVENIYMTIVNAMYAVSDNIEAICNLHVDSNISYEERKKQLINGFADRVRDIYIEYYECIGELNRKYGMNIKKRM